jgi:transposase
MANDPDEVSTKSLVDTKRKSLSGGRRREWPEALKRQMVAETLEPGASVSIVARRHDVNTNQLFKWRRELLPKAVPAVPAVVEGGAMVPVEIVAEQPRHRRRADRKGIIEIEFGSGARVSLRGEVVPAVLRQVIELLR